MDEKLSNTIALFHDFYSTAWTQLLTFGIAVAGLVGVVLPIAILLYQRKLLKDERQDIERELDNSLENAKSELKKEIDTARNELKASTNEDIENAIAQYQEALREEVNSEIRRLQNHAYRIDAQTYHLQATRLKKENEYPAAAESFCEAALYFLKADDSMNLKRTIKLLDECFLYINRSHFEKWKGLSESTHRFKEAIEKSSFADVFEDELENIENALQRDPGNEKFDDEYA